MTTQKNTPIKTIADGRLKAAIWRNESEKGPFYSVTFTRSYRDADGNWHDTDSFSGTDIVLVSRLASLAYGAISDLRTANRAADQSNAA